MITLRTLGSVDLLDSEGRAVASILTQPKRLGLMVYLACAYPRGFHRRDTILGLLWPELDEVRARNALSQSLSFLRRNLPEEAIVGRGADEVGIAEETVWVDTHAFATALDQERWVDALELYRGDFLRGFHLERAWEFGDWVEGEREGLREAAAGAAWALAREHVQTGDLVEAERTGQKALDLVWSDETPVREFIQSLAVAGDRAAALRFYERFRARLKHELEVEPSAGTAAVAEWIRNDAGVPEPSASNGSIPTLVSSPSPIRPDAVQPGGDSPLSGPPGSRNRARIRWAAVGGMAVTLSALGMYAMGGRRPTEPPPVALRQLTFDGNVGPAALSPNGEFLAYIVGENPARLMVRDLSGGTTLQVADSIWTIFGLRWSWDGIKIGVSGLQRDSWATYFYPRLGGPPEPAPQYVPFFRWSPDDRQLAGWFLEGPDGPEILMMDPRSGEVDHVSIQGEDRWVTGGDWSPDGDLLLLATNSGGTLSHLRILSAADGTERMSLRDSLGLDFPSWNTSGDAVYFLRNDVLFRATLEPTPGRVEGQDHRVRILEGLTRAPTLTTPYSISADGSRLVYTRTSGYTNFSVIRPGTATSSAPVMLTTGTARKSCPTLSPDGRSLAYLAESEEGLDLHVVATEGGDPPRRLTSGGFLSSLCPAWSPSGGELVISQAVEGRRRLGVIPAAGGSPRVFRETRPAGELVWSPGTRIAYPVRGHDNYRLLDPATGGEESLVENDSPYTQQLSFSPEGDQVVIRWTWPDSTGLWVISLGDRVARFVGGSKADWVPFGWSMDGTKILARMRLGGDFHWIPLDGGDPEVIPGPELEDMDCAPTDRPEGLVWICEEERSFSDAWMIENFDPGRE